MEEQRPLYVKRIILAFIISTIIFLFGFFVCYSITYVKYQSISVSQEQIRFSLMELDLQAKLMASSCNLLDSYALSSELDQMGSIMGIIEARLGKNNPSVLEQKKTYNLLEVQHFLLIDEHNLKCNNTIPTVLFFYSNNEQDKDQSEKIGFILTSLKKENPHVMIYSFDYNLDYSLVNMLKTKYNITSPNTVLLNEKIKIINLNNIDEVQKKIK
jgi:hypothetical protein